MHSDFLVESIRARAALQSGVAGPSLRVTDSKGTIVVVADAAIDYGGMVAKERNIEGIRLRKGDGIVTVRWTSIETIRVIAIVGSRKPVVHLEVILRNGKRHMATLVEKGRMLLVGTSELGDYSIDLHKVRLIAPVR